MSRNKADGMCRAVGTWCGGERKGKKKAHWPRKCEVTMADE